MFFKKLFQIQTETNDLEIHIDPKSTNTDLDKLALWLQNIYPLVKRELDEASNSQAFKDYKMYNDDEDATCKLLQDVNISKSVERYNQVNYKITSLIVIYKS